MAAVGVDVDDVLYGWFDAAHRLSEAAGITGGVVPTSWAPYEDYGCSAEDWHAVLAEGAVSGELYHDDPLPDVVESLRALKDAGHTVHLVTARGLLTNGHLIREHTVRWLHNHQVPHDTLTFSKDKSIVRTDYFIDDNLDNIRSVVPHVKRAYLIDRPWNQAPADASYWRVAGFQTATLNILYADFQQRHVLGVGQVS